MKTFVKNCNDIRKILLYNAIFLITVTDLTLVDLPGMTKVPVGDQDPNIEAQVHCKFFYANPSAFCCIPFQH